MIVHPARQGTDEWLEARIGIPTASAFGNIVTAAKGELSKSSRDYRYKLLCEWAMGVSQEDRASEFMDRGTALEPEAVSYYEVLTDTSVERVGLCLSDCRRYGASPDGLVGDDGAIEIKCASAHVHVGYLVGDPPVQKYRQQLQGVLWVCERQWIDLVLYNPEMPSRVVRVERDEDYIGKLSAAVVEFCDQLETDKERLRALGVAA